MKILSFEYVKTDTDITGRQFVPLSEPSDCYFGIDMTELDEEGQALFAEEMAQFFLSRQKELEALMKKYDLLHKFRLFKAAKMRNIVIDR